MSCQILLKILSLNIVFFIKASSFMEYIISGTGPDKVKFDRNSSEKLYEKPGHHNRELTHERE